MYDADDHQLRHCRRMRRAAGDFLARAALASEELAHSRSEVSASLAKITGFSVSSRIRIS